MRKQIDHRANMANTLYGARAYGIPSATLRILDATRTRVFTGPEQCGAWHVLIALRAAASEIEASSIDTLTAAGYVTFAMWHQRARHGDQWPQRRVDACILLDEAACMATNYERGSVVNVAA